MPRMHLALVAGAACLCMSAPASPLLAQQVPAPPPSPGTDVSQPPAAPAPAAQTAPVDASPAPAVLPEQVLRPGARGPAVRNLQRALRKRGIAVPVDGTYGARTRAGVRVLQRRMKVKATGIATAAVLTRLGVTVRTVAGTTPLSSKGGSFDEYPVPQPNDTTPSAKGFIWPTNGMVSSPFGPRWGRMHEGLDIAGPEGRPIRAAKAGIVITAGQESGYGNLIVLDHGNGETTRYGHLSAIGVDKGATVAIGQVIGRMGNTGRSTGTHLHFEVRVGGAAMDPLGFL